MTNVSKLFMEKFSQAQSLHKQGRFQDAETLFLSLLTSGENREQTLRALTQLYINSKRLQDAVDCFEQLITLSPDQIAYTENLANLHQHMGNIEKAISCIQALLLRNPTLANSHYNLAILQKQNRLFAEALTSYQSALKCHIEQPEEVYLNMAVIYSENLRQEDKATQALEEALSLNPHYQDALYNLATLKEEAGEKQAAFGLFQRIIDLAPDHYQAMARLADVKTFNDPQDPVIRRMKRGVRKVTIDLSTKINLHFALGKALNDCGTYAEAFENYQKANSLNKQTVGAYDRSAQETFIRQLKNTFSHEFFANMGPVSDASPIFICGMFRSGSTLTEQILASHPQVQAGGEIDFFVNKVHAALNPFPASMETLKPEILQAMADEYLDHLEKTFPHMQHITDKRPDNFLYIGLIKALFPKARIIFTRRNPLDNILSVYFLRLGKAMNYATDLEDTAHFYQQHLEVMAHWKSLFSDTVFEMNYDDLIKDPANQISELLTFCGLEWHDQCLDFHTLKNVVKTASVWQVRQPLYQKSSGRWRNYETRLESLNHMLDQ